VVAGKPLKKRIGRSVAKKPETLNIESVLEDTPAPVNGKPQKDSMGFEVDPAAESKAKLARQLEGEWDRIKVRVSEQTRIQVMTEFLREKGLFGELAKYAKKRIR
jgi:hypothetical protein